MVEPQPNKQETRYVMNSGEGRGSAGWLIAGAVLAVAIIAGVVWYNSGQPASPTAIDTPQVIVITPPAPPAPEPAPAP